MTRRKVTMLEAFQDSARTTLERRDAALSQSTTDEADRNSSIEGRLEIEEAPASAARQSIHDGPAIVPVGEAQKGAGAGTEISTEISTGNGSESQGARGDASTKKPARKASGGGLTLPFSWVGFTMLQALLLVGAFLVGRAFDAQRLGLIDAEAPASSDALLGAASFDLPGLGGASRSASVPASVGKTSPPSSTAAPVAASGAAAVTSGDDPDTDADRAFVDPAMRYTVLAITYSGTVANEALAWQTYDLLQAQGFPVVKPLERNARIFLFVGAAKNLDQLGDVRDRLQKLRVGPRQTPDFREAYVVNLELYRR